VREGCPEDPKRPDQPQQVFDVEDEAVVFVPSICRRCLGDIIIKQDAVRRWTWLLTPRTIDGRARGIDDAVAR